MNGWIKVHRGLLDSPVWTSANAEGRVILMTLLLSVTPVPYKSFWNGQEIVVQPGQLITSIEGICARTGLLVTPQNVRTMLRKCKQAGFLTEEVTKTGRLITITNWGFYQSSGEGVNKAAARQLTNSPQRANMLATLNRAEKKDKTTKNCWKQKDLSRKVQQSQNYNGREYSDDFLAGLYKEV